jgi:hypothetical protein
MGGRGRVGQTVTRNLDLANGRIEEAIEVRVEQPYRRPTPPAADLPHQHYHVLSTAWDGVGTPEHPLLPKDRAWIMLARDQRHLNDPEAALRPEHTFGMTQPTLTWTNDSEVIEIYVDGLDYAAFKARYGYAFENTKRELVMHKRMSRMLRDYRLHTQLPADEVRIDILDLDPTGQEVWDGSGLISRTMLERLSISDHLSEATRHELRQELQHIGRIEFTVITGAGQYKGHAVRQAL